MDAADKSYSLVLFDIDTHVLGKFCIGSDGVNIYPKFCVSQNQTIDYQNHDSGNHIKRRLAKESVGRIHGKRGVSGTKKYGKGLIDYS